MRSKSNRTVGLLALLLGACALLGGLGWLLQRPTALERERSGASLLSSAARSASIGSSVSIRTALSAPALSVPAPSAPTSEANAGATRTATEIPTASLAGRLTIDGSHPRAGKLRLRSHHGTWRREAALDDDGRFLVDRLPPTPLVLAFEIESGSERALLLPEVEVTPALESESRLELDWRTKQINLRVVGAVQAGASTIAIEGPGYRTSVLTNGGGKARLSLVGEGHFSFRATRAGAKLGGTEVDIEADEELITIVLAAEG